MSEHFLVTGGAGFIGSHLVTALVEQGIPVRVLDNFSTGRRENLAHLEGRFELLVGDLRSLDDCRRAVAGCTHVLHQGAIPAVPRSVADPVLTNAANVDGTLHLLVAARDAGVRRVVFASSSSVYGDTEVMPKHEGLAPAPMTPYALQKLTGEFYHRIFASLYGLETVSLRYFNVFGPRQDPASDYAAVIPKFVTAMLAGRQPTIYGDGHQSRDFTFVGNVVVGNLLAARTGGPAVGQALNLACGDRISLLELVAALRQILGVAIEPRFEAARPGDVKHSQAAVDRARDWLKFSPPVSFVDGLARTVEWYRQQAGAGSR